MDTGSVQRQKQNDIYKDITGDVEKQFGTLNYDERKGKRPLSVPKN